MSYSDEAQLKPKLHHLRKLLIETAICGYGNLYSFMSQSQETGNVHYTGISRPRILGKENCCVIEVMLADNI